jgi:hypothetical protein
MAIQRALAAERDRASLLAGGAEVDAVGPHRQAVSTRCAPRIAWPLPPSGITESRSSTVQGSGPQTALKVPVPTLNSRPADDTDEATWRDRL